jgi:hypothetical protein
MKKAILFVIFLVLPLSHSFALESGLVLFDQKKTIKELN